MDSAEFIHRLHFAFTVTYHYLFPQLTMGLAPLIVALKTLALWNNDQRYDDAARFWAKIFGITFVFGVVTGIPMEFQFGTNWSHFSKYAGGVIGQTLAMEGTFAFFLESAFLGLFLYGEKRLSQDCPLVVGDGRVLSAPGSRATSSSPPTPGCSILWPMRAPPTARVTLTSFWGLVLNPWAIWQYAHNMAGAGVTGAFVMMAVGAFYLLSKQHVEQARIFLKVGVVAALIFVTAADRAHGRRPGTQPGASISRSRWPPWKRCSSRSQGAPLVIIGQPDVEHRRSTIRSSCRAFSATSPTATGAPTCRGWTPSRVPSGRITSHCFTSAYHIMVGLGTIFMAVCVIAALLLWRKQLFEARWMLWILLLSFPLPFIANTAGWMTAEIGRQPYLVYGLMRTANGYSKSVSAGNGWFTLLGFLGMYTILSILFLFLIHRELEHGPETERCFGHREWRRHAEVK